MSRPKRFFTNKMLDYDGAPIHLPVETIRKRCVALISEIFSNQKTSFQDCDGGLYVGVAGVSYMCHYLAHLSAFEKEKSQLLKKGEEYLNCALSSLDHPQLRGDKTLQVSFLLGNGGMNVLAALVTHALGRRDDCQMYLSRYAAMADFCLPTKFLSCGSDELFVGRAGYLCGALLLNKKLGRECVSRQMLYALCQSIVQSGREYARRHRSASPLMYAYYGTEYLGAGHGLAAILQMLLNVPDYLSTHLDAERDIKGAVDYLLRLQTPSGNFPCATDEIAQDRPEEEELVHWCHGAPGTIYLMAKAYQRWRDEAYLRSCLMCGEIVWRKGLLKKGPGICHGVAGNGYVFLLLYQLTHNPKHLHRALQFAEFIFTDDFKRARTPDCPYSLFEGLAGTTCYLADLLEPDNAQFPFFDIF